MKVLLVSASDIGGGAARATYRLHQALLSEGVDSYILVQNKISDDFKVLTSETKKEKVLYKLRPFLDPLPLKFYKHKTKSWFSPALLPFSNIADRINAINPDVVHLHWINEGMMNIDDIAKIKAPIVWSLHDMWPFTGGCHYDESCGRYAENCGKCKVLGSQKENDLSRKVFNKKQKAYENVENMTVIGLSEWLTKCAKNSTLFGNKNVINLPNLINTDIYKPFKRDTARELLHLPKDKKLVLFGAMGATSDPRKGFTELSEAMSKLTLTNIEFVVIGSSQPQKVLEQKYVMHYMGHLHDDVTLQLLYSAVDSVVVPSLQENLSNVIMESMSCGTPVVAFDIGGNSDMIEHKKNGYLATPSDAEDLAKGIEWVLAHKTYEELGASAREKVLSLFDAKIVAKQYIGLYEKVAEK